MSNIDTRMVRARSILIREHPFFGSLAMRLTVVERNDIKTLATDGKFLFYCLAFLSKIPESELLFCIAHEVLHCALSHMTRRGNRAWELWQAATDYVVNPMLHDAGFTVPKWVKYFDEKYRGLNVEQVCKLLEQEKQQQQQQPQPQSGSAGQSGGAGDDMDEEEKQEDDYFKEQDQCESSTGEDGDPSDSNSKDGKSSTSKNGSAPGEPGSSPQTPSADGDPSESSDGNSTQGGTEPNYAPAHGDPGGCGEVLDAGTPYDQAKLDEVADEWQVYTRQAANVARRLGEGRLPGFIEELIDVLNDPQTDWRHVLRRFVDPSFTKDYSWTNLNRRLISLGYYSPGVISDGVNHAAFIVDSSGSISYEWLKQSGAEVQAALDDGAIDKLTLMFVDDVVHKVVEYNKGDIIDFTVLGRGGTRFSPAFAWLNQNAPDVSVAIYLTDLECTDYGPPPSYPVLWAVYGSDPRAVQHYMEHVPFGEAMELK